MEMASSESKTKTPAAPERPREVPLESRKPVRWAWFYKQSVRGEVEVNAIVISILLVALVVGTYLLSLNNGFVSLDDARYVSANAHVVKGLAWEGIRWACSTVEGGLWHPLTWLSLMLDAQLFGSRAGGYHLTSMLFHAANTVLLFVVLRRMTGAACRSAFVAVLFALHPIHVESVAWVSERKDVLFAFFGFLTLLAYATYVE